jgi:hypothetical protein
MSERNDKLIANLLKVVSIFTGLALWHVLAVYVVNDPTFLVSPIVVVYTSYDMLFVTGELYPHLFASSWIFFYGFALAIVLGVPLGFIMALSPAALKGGSVQASFMGPPFTFRAAKDGFRKLANFHEHLGPILFTTDFAHANYMKSNRAEIVRYLRAMIEATRWLYDPKNKEEALAIHMKVLKSPRESAEEDYKYLVRSFSRFRATVWLARFPSTRPWT